MTKKYHQLNQEQRYQIEALIQTGTSKTAIAAIVGIDRSTVYRVLKRNSVCTAKQPVYKAATAQHFAVKRAYLPRCRACADPAIIRRLKWLLTLHWSPEQIARTCAKRAIAMQLVLCRPLQITTKRYKRKPKRTNQTVLQKRNRSQIDQSGRHKNNSGKIKLKTKKKTKL